MKYIFFILLCLTNVCLYSQSKGVSTLTTNNKQLPIAIGTTKTYAVVVGISDYQDKDIPDLRFADKDAEAFANYLRSEAGGKLDADHLKLLINQQATMAQMANVLDWLMENCKEGDQAIIYFSGHGDVEKRTLTQPGFLLCWDAPARVYMAGGAFALPMLQEVISTLSIQNKAKVIVITDACRSGNLAGSSIGGSQATAANLAKQYANEIKILSCQPNEYSLEGEQWGGGRGAFSFNLVDALYGMADVNGDLMVNLREVGRYLEDHVAAEVAPVSQNPKVVGDPNERLATVNAKLLADIRSGRTSQMAILSAIDSRGMEDDVLAAVDSTVREMYRFFKKALKDKLFLEPATACADFYYKKLIAEPGLARLHSTMRRNYAAALQDDAQQVLNVSLNSGLTNLVTNSALANDIYKNYPAYLNRAAELLGKEHYMYPILHARKHYFEGKLSINNIEKRRAFHQALEWQPDMPHALSEMISSFSSDQADSAEYYFNKTTSLTPNWVVPYLLYATYHYEKRKQFNRAEELLDQALKIDSSSLFVWYERARFFNLSNRDSLAEFWFLKTIHASGSEICFPCARNQLGLLIQSQGRTEEAYDQFKKAIQLDSSFLPAYINLKIAYFNANRFDEAESLLNIMLRKKIKSNLAYFHLATIYEQRRQYAQAEELYKKSILEDSSSIFGWYGLGILYCDILHRFPEAEYALKKVLSLDSSQALNYYNLGNVYLNSNQSELAEPLFKRAIELDSSFNYAYNNLGLTYQNLGRYEEAEAAFKKSIQLNPMDFYVYSFLAGLYFEQKKYEDAEANIKKSIQLNPDYIDNYNNLGNLYLDWPHRNSEAEELFRKAIQLNPNHYPANYNLGRVFLNESRYKEAEQQFLKVLQLDPAIYQGYYMMACLKSLLNQPDEAFHYLERAFQNGYPTFHEMLEDKNLNLIKNLEAKWNALVEKYFDQHGNRR